MMTAEQLKSSILQLAVQGKLVPQNPNDEPASKLLKKIEAEKKKLIKEKKIKKTKPLPPITKNEIPFEIPESWEWVRLGEIFQHNTGKALNGSDNKGKYLTYITTSNLYWNSFELNDLKTMPFTNSEIEKCTVQKGDLLICEGGDYGRSAIWNYDFNVRIQNHIHRVRPYLILCIKYFYYVIYYQKNTNQIKGKGIGIQGLSSNTLHNILIPLPPLAEQYRIVNKMDKLMPLVEQYGDISEKMNNLNLNFPSNLKKSVLQLAVQGKLVPQNPNDEPASELLKKIEAEKKKLIKEKKIKKPKPLPPITKDEIPFEIPESWEWVRLGNFVNYNMGKTPPRKDSKYWINAKYPWVSISDMVENGIITCTKECINQYSADNIFKNKESPAGTLLMSFKLTVGKVSILDINAYHNEAIISIYPYLDKDNIERNYLFKILPFMVQFGNTKSAIKGNTLNSQSLNELLIPIPPLAEQYRIVDKLDKIMKNIEVIENING